MFTLNCNGRLLVIRQPVVMGILNATPDSFYAASRHSAESAALTMVETMLEDGATIVDIGGQSTAPGSIRVSEDEELQRVIGIIEAVHNRFPELILSIDTYYSNVAQQAVQAGVGIVNDISAGTLDSNMLTTVGKLNVPYIAMHMRGTPQTMNTLAQYDNVTTDVLDYFIQRMDDFKRAGIKDIIIDPGFGFAKTIAHNFELLRNLDKFRILQKPLLAGLSRKSTIYKTLGIKPDESLNGTTVLNTLALINGASILRVHDVKPAMECVRLLMASGWIKAS